MTKHILKHHKREQDEYIGKEDIIIKKGKKSVKDPAAIDFLEKSMIVLGEDGQPIDPHLNPPPTKSLSVSNLLQQQQLPLDENAQVRRLAGNLE